MTLTRQVLDRWLHWGACAITAVFVVAVLGQQSLAPVAYPPAVFTAWAVAASTTLAWALRDAWVCRPVPWGLRACVLVALLAGAVQVIGDWRLPGVGTVPPLLQAMGPAFGIAGFALSPRIAAVLGLVCGGVYVVSDLRVIGSPLAFGAGIVVGGSGLVAAGAIDLLHRAAAKVEQAVNVQWKAREAAGRATARAEGKEWWDGLIHDKVLGALRLASRARDDADRRAAAELAKEALSLSVGPGERADGERATLRTRLAATCERLGLIMVWRVRDDRGALPPEVDLAVVGAAEEALTNAARHSGRRGVTVSGSITSSVALDIVDDGIGFDVRAPRPGRIGIDRGIRARLARIGGSASVLSEPRGGTTVRLRAPVDAKVGTEAASVPVELWKHRDFLAIFVLGCVMTAVFSLIGASQHDAVVSPWVLGLVVGAVPGLGLFGTFAPAGRRGGAALLAVGVASVVLVGTGNLRDPYNGNWGFWFIGGLNATVTLIVGRFSAFWGAVAVTGAGGGMALGQAYRGGHIDVALIVVVLPQMLAFGCAAWGVRRALDLATEAINAAAGEQGVLRLADARAEESSRVAESRSTEVLHLTGGLLTRIVAAEVLDNEGRALARLAEAEARDGLVAGLLLTPRLREVIRQARERLAVVALSADVDGDPVGLDEFRHVVSLVVESAPPGSRVNARLRADDRGRVGSVTLVGQFPETLDLQQLRRRIQEAAGTMDLLLSVEDDVLVEMWSPSPLPADHGPSQPQNQRRTRVR